jgi:hypothetical protein
MMAWEKLKWTAAGTLAALGLAAGALAQQSSKERAPLPPPPLATTSQRPETPSPRPADNQRWVKRFANGATVEVVGISSCPSGPKTWWKPDGQPMVQPPSDGSTDNSAAPVGEVRRIVVVRVSKLPAGADYRCSIDQTRGGSRGSASLNGKSVPDLFMLITTVPEVLAACSVRFEVAVGPWRTIRTWATAAGAVGGNSEEPSFMFSEAIATKTGTKCVVTHNIRNDVAFRFVAIDNSGNEHPASTPIAVGTGGFFQVSAEFDLSPGQIKEFRVQTRPFEKLEIPNVALNPLSSED